MKRIMFSLVAVLCTGTAVAQSSGTGQPSAAFQALPPVVMSKDGKAVVSGVDGLSRAAVATHSSRDVREEEKKRCRTKRREEPADKRNKRKPRCAAWWEGGEHGTRNDAIVIGAGTVVAAALMESRGSGGANGGYGVAQPLPNRDSASNGGPSSP